MRSAPSGKPKHLLLGGLGEAVASPNGGLGETPPMPDFHTFETAMHLIWKQAEICVHSSPAQEGRNRRKEDTQSSETDNAQAISPATDTHCLNSCRAQPDAGEESFPPVPPFRAAAGVFSLRGGGFGSRVSVPRFAPVLLTTGADIVLCACPMGSAPHPHPLPLPLPSMPPRTPRFAWRRFALLVVFFTCRGRFTRDSCASFLVSVVLGVSGRGLLRLSLRLP